MDFQTAPFHSVIHHQLISSILVFASHYFLLGTLACLVVRLFAAVLGRSLLNSGWSGMDLETIRPDTKSTGCLNSQAIGMTRSRRRANKYGNNTSAENNKSQWWLNNSITITIVVTVVSLGRCLCRDGQDSGTCNMSRVSTGGIGSFWKHKPASRGLCYGAFL